MKFEDMNTLNRGHNDPHKPYPKPSAVACFVWSQFESGLVFLGNWRSAWAIYPEPKSRNKSLWVAVLRTTEKLKVSKILRSSKDQIFH